MCVARLVCHGDVSCVIGRLGPMYNGALDHMDGRLAQITEMWANSQSRHKIDYSTSHNGVARAELIDNYTQGDRALSMLLHSVDCDSSEVESNSD